MNRYREMYAQKLKSPENAVKNIKSGSHLVKPMANGEPPAIMNAIAARIRSGDLADIGVTGALDARISGFYAPDLSQYGLSIESGFLTPLLRAGVGNGSYSFIPGHLSEISSMVFKFRNIVSYIVLVVSPMDDHGNFSVGTHCDFAFEFLRYNPDYKSVKVIVEVNNNMPRTYGATNIHINEIEAVVENHVPLFELPTIPVSEEERLIGQFIAEEIPDGACVQIGIGGIPNAVARYLADKKDLGVHTEMFVDSYVDLFEKGAVTCSMKKHAPGQMVAAFAVGSKKIYDFVNDNPMVQFFPNRVVNDPFVIAQNDNFMSINSTLEVDLTGQCASESVGHRQFSGTGGQVDFTRGAMLSKGGKSFMALPSTYTDKEGKMHSKIRATLAEGTVVTTTRTDVQYVVTEYGVALLKGYSVADRAKRLIKIAHPDFRDLLAFDAKKLGYLR